MNTVPERICKRPLAYKTSRDVKYKSIVNWRYIVLLIGLCECEGFIVIAAGLLHLIQKPAHN